jgi:transmembrane sensor
LQKEDFIPLAQKFAQNKCSLSEKEVVEIFFQKRIEEEENSTILFTEEKRKAILNRINAKISKPKRELRALYFKTATIAAIGIALIEIVFLFNPEQNQRTIIQSTAKGEQKTLLLPDGSQILLNANSSLSYSSDYKTNRNLILVGKLNLK